MRRFFSDDSFWNAPLEKDPEIDPRNDHFLKLLAQKPGGPLWINLDKFTIPVYEVDATTPRVTVHQRLMDPARMSSPTNRWGRWTDRKVWWKHGPGFGADVPIPAHATPDSASDSHMALVDWSTHTAWDMWGCYRRADGQWESNVGMVYSLDSTGVWKTSDFPEVKDGDSIHFHGPSRAAGVPAIAGLIMHDEIRAGVIRHKLAFASWHNALQEFVAPAAWTDGFTPGGLPEGAVMQLDPALNPRDFDLSPAAEVIFRALQQYGMVNVDVAGGNTLYGEGLWAHPTRSWRGLLEQGALEKVPLEHYRTLKLGPITRMGDSPRQPNL
jgi:hypothetical protein